MKAVFTIINLFLVAAMAYLCVDFIYNTVQSDGFFLPDENFSAIVSKDIHPLQTKSASGRDQHDVIIKRNLFKVDIEKKEIFSEKQETKEKEPEQLEATNLKLVLWGTVTGDMEVYAVIEDKKSRQQSLYQVGDSIQNATIKKILRHEIILTFQGKDQVLEMETDHKKISRAGKSAKKIYSNPISMKKKVFERPDDTISAVMKQIKFRPHFTQGEADGLMVYGIRPNSIFRQIGLRNGDIIKDINGTPIVSAEDASSLFTEIEGADNARVTLFRRGRVKELVYQANGGQHVIEAVPEMN